MAAAKAGIVYGTASGIVRRIIVPDFDKQLERGDWIAPGESLLVVDMEAVGRAGVPSIHVATQAVEKHRGVPSLSARCAVVDERGDVTAVIMADPDIDSVADRELARHERVNTGWKRDRQRDDWLEPVEVVEDRDGEQTPTGEVLFVSETSGKRFEEDRDGNLIETDKPLVRMRGARTGGAVP